MAEESEGKVLSVYQLVKIGVPEEWRSPLQEHREPCGAPYSCQGLLLDNFLVHYLMAHPGYLPIKGQHRECLAIAFIGLDA